MVLMGDEYGAWDLYWQRIEFRIASPGGGEGGD